MKYVTLVAVLLITGCCTISEEQKLHRLDSYIGYYQKSIAQQEHYFYSKELYTEEVREGAYRHFSNLNYRICGHILQIHGSLNSTTSLTWDQTYYISRCEDERRAPSSSSSSPL